MRRRPALKTSSKAFRRSLTNGVSTRVRANSPNNTASTRPACSARPAKKPLRTGQRYYWRSGPPKPPEVRIEPARRRCKRSKRPAGPGNWLGGLPPEARHGPPGRTAATSQPRPSAVPQESRHGRPGHTARNFQPKPSEGPQDLGPCLAPVNGVPLIRPGSTGVPAANARPVTTYHAF